MQILFVIVCGMGYQGLVNGLLDVEINLKYGVKYLCGVYMVVEGDKDDVVKWYLCGYYYEVKKKGFLDVIGLC